MDNDEERLIRSHLEDIRRVASSIDRDITIMEICGGHTNVIMKYGIREALPKNVRLISGPGCPVCVSSQHDIDCMIALAHDGVPIATYGDMLRVPGSQGSLEEAKARYGNVFEVYSATEVLGLRQKYPDIVFFGIGFETTAPMTAFLLSKGVRAYSVHKLVPPAMMALVDGEIAIDGFIDPGHVSTIIGTQDYSQVDVAQVIAGFSAERILRAILLLCELIRDGKKQVINGYPEAVRAEGNIKARKLLEQHFRVADSEWRGLGTIPRSGLEVRDKSLDAKVIYKEMIAKVPAPKRSACRCGDVLKGIIDPTGCPLFGVSCNPEDPKGACMVSDEGSCAIFYRHKGAK